MKLYLEKSYTSAENFFEALLPTGVFRREHSSELSSWLFRGQGDAAWGLRPKAFRPNALAVNTPANFEWPFISSHDHARLELDGIIRFAVHADRAGFLLPGDAPPLRDPRLANDPTFVLTSFPPTEYLALAALGQHYGIPTRLLDWTWKPLVAAYFASLDCANNPTDTRASLAVWALSSQFVNSVGRAHDPSFYLISAPAATNPNLHAQGGIFTLVQPRSAETASVQLQNIDDLLFALDDADVDPVAHSGSWLRERWSPVFYKLTLPATEARVLLRLLGEAGISAASVFPGLEGVARSLLEQRRWQIAPPGDRSR
jgi:hypothetical protein